MQRKLAAILSADVVGYSALMEGDEAGTLALLKQNRTSIFEPQTAAHGGRIFKLLGDGALAEFPSVVDAVACALAIQELTAGSGAENPSEKFIRYRIGVNLGDVIIEGDDIYGEGVNVAARLQTLAPNGGVAVSRIVRDQVEGKSPCSFEDMGEHSVKAGERPVHVFVLHPHAATSGQKSGPRAGGPTICVLPFANMSDDPQQEYFSDGISEDIITDLSKVSALNVIARNTAFQFKGKNVDVARTARDVKASHILEGSVRKAGSRLRITAQLIDGKTGNHLWAERYDRNLDDIFALQDEISEAIVKALKLRLLPEEKRAIESRGTNNTKAYNFYLMARQFYLGGNAGSPRRAEAIIRLARRATELDPNYARAWAQLAFAQIGIARFQLSVEDAGDGGRAAAERALALDPELGEAHAAMAQVYLNAARHAEALREIETALHLEPESIEVIRSAASVSFATRRHEEAIRYFRKSASLVPGDYTSVGMLLSCYGAAGDKDALRETAREVLARTERAIALEPDNGSAMSYQLHALAILGERDRARDLVEKALVLDPHNRNMRYNFACAFASTLKDFDTALELLAPMFRDLNRQGYTWVKTDVDLDGMRDDPRFKAMMAEAEARIAKEQPLDS